MATTIRQSGGCLVDPKIARSRAQERRGVKQHGGSQNVGSGNTPYRKSDVRLDRDYLIEYKRTDKKSLTIKLEDLETNRTNAYLEGRNPLFGIELGGRDWIMVEASEFERIRSGCAGTGLVGGEVPDDRPGVVLPPTGEGVQEATPSGQRRVSRVPRSRGVS